MKSKSKMKFKRITCIAGAVMDREIKACNRISNTQRRPRYNLSSESVRRYNSLCREKYCSRLVNNNFMPGDLHVTLTYRIEPASISEADRILKAFIRRLRRRFKKADKVLKYFGTTEHRNHRMHHHMIMTGIEYQVIAETWGLGLINCVPLDRTRDYTRLVKYLMKESELTVKEYPNSGKKRYISSSNLEKPVLVEQEVTAAELSAEIKDVKGYHIDEDSIRRYENPITGIEHLEYKLIADDVDNPRLKIWPRGNRRKMRESYLRFEECRQLGLFDDYDYKLI